MVEELTLEEDSTQQGKWHQKPLLRQILATMAGG